jgi:hypothetical protein
MLSGAVGASMLPSAVTVASSGIYQSGHGINHDLYHDTKGGIYHCIHHEMKGDIYRYICHDTKQSIYHQKARYVPSDIPMIP